MRAVEIFLHSRKKLLFRLLQSLQNVTSLVDGTRWNFLQTRDFLLAMTQGRWYFCNLFYDSVSTQIIRRLIVGQYMVTDLLEVLSHNLPGGSEEYNENYQSGKCRLGRDSNRAPPEYNSITQRLWRMVCACEIQIQRHENAETKSRKQCPYWEVDTRISSPFYGTLLALQASDTEHYPKPMEPGPKHHILCLCNPV
jgi:hypothetical protein